MILNKEKIKHIAKLAQLDLSEKEVAKFQKQLSSILEYIKLLDNVDTDKVEPTAQTTGLKNVSSEDEPQEGQCLRQEEALSNAPEKQDGLVKTIKSVKPVTQ